MTITLSPKTIMSWEWSWMESRQAADAGRVGQTDARDLRLSSSSVRRVGHTLIYDFISSHLHLTSFLSLHYHSLFLLMTNGRQTGASPFFPNLSKTKKKQNRIEQQKQNKREELVFNDVYK